MRKTKIAVFASGTGSNYEAIMDQINAGQLACEVALLVCDQPNAKVIGKAEELGTPLFVFDPKQYESKATFENEIVQRLQEQGVELIILAGYMRLIGPTLLAPYESKIINIHPSLLPAFPGKDAVGQAIEAGVRVAGVTIHFVDEGMDTGQIIDQQALYVEKGETRDSLQKRIQAIEHRLFPQTIQKLIEEQAETGERGASI
ncbi:phosphoribosylglycinamide formyltransferase [Aquibacillus koreensis]|uniref:Phosphoribosylglycinamide formyltransferase n=1 Tax=Aquibacillus koreensis TaxID=279446 RepID=A0A9X4AIY2_9BACI|nr:phosphoribosylglycinamide formyltransferase [Aquibacillus koreensis]MCT2536793.1 phosphoribosylglycinamide formyltransferase [Aquibacillus koreensis]MDC3421451.1 phosphoribosylglycinamide formyltransferase [Aquibacillus koreensis]